MYTLALSSWWVNNFLICESDTLGDLCAEASFEGFLCFHSMQQLFLTCDSSALPLARCRDFCDLWQQRIAHVWLCLPMAYGDSNLLEERYVRMFGILTIEGCPVNMLQPDGLANTSRFQHIERVRRRAPTLLVVDDEATGKQTISDGLQPANKHAILV